MGDPDRIRRSRTSTRTTFDNRRRFEHWYVDNQVYFLTARVRNRLSAFASESAKAIFWRQFETYTDQCGFTPWVTSLLDNHWHTIGYLRQGDQLARMMRLLHGSVAKLVNDVLEDMSMSAKADTPLPGGGVPTSVGMWTPTRIASPFWKDSGHQNYFDGCLRDLKQGRYTYRYVHTQCRRHGICDDPRDYPHMRINVEMERALRRAEELQAFLKGVGYKRYGTRPQDHVG